MQSRGLPSYLIGICLGNLGAPIAPDAQRFARSALLQVCCLQVPELMLCVRVCSSMHAYMHRFLSFKLCIHSVLGADGDSDSTGSESSGSERSENETCLNMHAWIGSSNFPPFAAECMHAKLGR